MILRRVSNRGPTVTHISALLKFQSILLYVFEDIPEVFLKTNIFNISPQYSFENQSRFRDALTLTGEDTLYYQILSGLRYLELS